MVKILLPLITLALITPTEAHAYLDPGSGSQFLQIILGFVLGGLFTLKVFWKRILFYLKRIFKDSSKNKS
ncbi:hypothetical protein HYS95_01710 [Candidatus Daviesbacteria bacterium]|nr:hypothetical protein [Candidatus Daviesbacteria bacterium]